MRLLRILSLVICLTSLLALAQQPAAAQSTTDAKPATATVYIYRYKQFVGSALAPSVWCDETELARAENGRYFTVKLDPGKHSFRSNDKQSGIELDMKAGREYFLRVEIATGFAKGHGRLVLMSAEQGIYELKSSKLKPLDPSKVVDKARVSVEEASPEPPVATSKAPATVAAPPVVQSSSSQHTVTGETVSGGDGALIPASQTGEQTSVAEAARRAREKK